MAAVEAYQLYIALMDGWMAAWLVSLLSMLCTRG